MSAKQLNISTVIGNINYRHKTKLTHEQRVNRMIRLIRLSVKKNKTSNSEIKRKGECG